ncbi:MAG: NCS1 family nucleobase:cation symporter-1 [Pirellulales bacterium]|nr:NCS1 family nucleobase:cation symporter-1 [Pirellulales bacterium]
MTSDLINPDIAPTPPEGRTWSKWHLAALWIGMSVCIPTYMLAASMIKAGMTWWQSVLTVLLGNLIVLIPMILMGHAGTKYGIPFPVLARASFGTRGAHIPAIARSLVACGWFGIQTWIGGFAIYQVFGALGWIDVAADTALLPILNITALQFVCFLAFWALNFAIVLRGIDCIKWLESWAAPFLIAMGLALLIWAAIRVGGVTEMFPPPPDEPPPFWPIFFPQLTAMVGFWATLSLNIPDFTRYCRSQKDQALGQLIGLPTTMTLFSFIGIAVTSATVVIFGQAIWDPIALVAQLGSTTAVVVSLIALTIATLSTNIAANVVSPANGFANLSPRRISFRTGSIITCLIGIVIMPWRLYNDLGDYIFTWLIGYSALLGPIAGIMLCDYFLVRRTRLQSDALYQEEGIYSGIRWKSVLILVIAVLPNLPGFYNAATHTGTFPPIFDQLYSYAWFLGITIAFVLYALLHLGEKQHAPTSTL